MRNYALATKAFSLGQEIRYIRKQEVRARNSARYHRAKQNTTEAEVYAYGRYSMYVHGKRLSTMARATHLARMFLAGVPYRDVENTTKGAPLYQVPGMVKEIATNIARYGTNPFGVPFGYPPVGFTEGIEIQVKNWLKGIDTKE